MTRPTLLTGLSGTGKSTVTGELAARGYRAVDTDYDGLSELVSAPADELTGHEDHQSLRQASR
jgi:dephospho-CoA kinase